MGVFICFKGCNWAFWMAWGTHRFHTAGEVSHFSEEQTQRIPLRRRLVPGRGRKPASLPLVGGREMDGYPDGVAGAMRRRLRRNCDS